VPISIAPLPKNLQQRKNQNFAPHLKLNKIQQKKEKGIPHNART
jgi:hypothetical protein